ncbi:MAG TPA: AraC family ligand binding domain-containing protein, partial [Opitutaceae bacterium]|nr:AraC family ligand binding domain-containing protein [Opitutaceae bacterium]
MIRDPDARREGFKGQHMAVLPRPLWSQSRRHPLLRGLCVTDAGYFPEARRHLVERPQGAPTTLVILCLGGGGWVRTAGQETEVGPGSFTWLPAGEAHAYGSGGSGAWTIVWAHFTGEEVESWREMLGLGSPGRPLGLSLPAERLGEIG